MPAHPSAAALRDFVGDALRGLHHHTHQEISGVLERMSLPTGEGTKLERLNGATQSVQDADLLTIATRMISEPMIGRAEKHALQDALWAADNPPAIPTRTRRELARALDIDDLAYDAERFRSALGRWWMLGSDDVFSVFDALLGAGSSPLTLAGQIEQHVFRNRGDWSAEKLFDEIGAIEAVGTRFARFVEDLASADTVPDEPTQRRIVQAANPHLQRIGYELRESDHVEGYPVFAFVATGTARNHAPKNLIFASPDKPDLRFRDALDNEIEILSDPDKVLVYDRPIPRDGLLWRDLQQWWLETRGSASEEAAKSELYRRLKAALPPRDVSPPQHHLFDLYHEIHGPAVPALPALLPEVWLHWDPKTAQQRGRNALLNFRMDFLLLLPHHQRVVIEVDGTHHYSREGKAAPRVYADTMRGDRDLKLAGYEVFRFGAADLLEPDSARALLADFFADLFRRFEVSPAPQ